MNREQIIRAWKDEDFRESLNEAQRSLLPVHPSGLIDLSDVELNSVAGGTITTTIITIDTCSFSCFFTIFDGTCVATIRCQVE
ncbi:MAG TPA: mersacidin/lichenicidin family type 2 lantibiotic [Pyrinomonadaceae bacterium]|jgi:mersacidin/lichenicidin family type 2 lantibiotic|nr:mersacidin/lichenicidin family type 2 lantibiotic [Pyrinomonadaceae bacterium]